MGYLELAIAIIAEVLGTNFMKASMGFTKLTPSLITVFFYIVCFYALSLSLRTIDLGVAYATWGWCRNHFNNICSRILLEAKCKYSSNYWNCFNSYWGSNNQYVF